MTPRAASGLLVSALIRRVEAAGGSAMVLARGDAAAGALLIQLAERGVAGSLLERRLGLDGYEWGEAGPTDTAAKDAYIHKRRRDDPDLWVIEIDHPQAGEIAIEMLG